jgi:small subunit ribosomal protein S14
MAKKSLIQRNYKRERLIHKYSKKRQSLLKKFKKTNSLSTKFKAHTNLQKLPRNSSKVRFNNRCWLTGRSRGVYKDFGLCRHMIRKMAHNCFLPGIRKASW